MLNLTKPYIALHNAIKRDVSLVSSCRYHVTLYMPSIPFHPYIYRYRCICIYLYVYTQLYPRRIRLRTGMQLQLWHVPQESSVYLADLFQGSSAGHVSSIFKGDTIDPNIEQDYILLVALSSCKKNMCFPG